MPHNIRLNPHAGLLVFRFEATERKFIPHTSFYEFSNNEECYLLNLRDKTLYRGIYKRLDENEFKTLNLARFGAVYDSPGNFFMGSDEFQLDEQGKVEANPNARAYKMVSLSSTAPGLPVPGIGFYSFTNVDQALIPELATAVDQAALNKSINEMREDLEITEVLNRFYSNVSSETSLKRWQLYHAFYNRNDKDFNPLVRAKLLKLVELYQSDQMAALDLELRTPIAAVSLLSFLSRAVVSSSGAEQKQERGISCTIL